MKLTHDDVAKILKLLEASAFDELELELDGLKLVLRRRGGAPVHQAASPATSAEAPPSIVAVDGTDAINGRELTAVVDATDVIAPLLGTFYRAPRPGAPPFVDRGARVAADTVVCVIEVMKMMTSVTAGVAGEVVEILATDGALVEYGQPLLRIRTPA
jgi:acetyl-CoA carboxylase biotin carboxyl carrier protein